MDTDKTAASNSSLKIPKSRSGRRPLSVTTLLRKDREGTLSKRHIKHNLDDARDKTLDTIEQQSKSAGKNGAGFDLQGKTTVQDLPNVGSVSPISIDGLKAKLNKADGRGIKKIGSGLGSEQASLDYRDGDRPDMTGLPAILQRRKGEGPTREMQDPYPNPKVENRQEIQETKLMESPSPSEGFLDTGKVAELGHDRALGDQRKSWEGPTRDEVGASASDHHRLQTATGAESVRLSDISPEAKVAHLEASIRRGLLDELTKIGQANGVMPWSGNYSDFASSQLVDDLVKEALFRELGSSLGRGLIGGMSPQGVPVKGLLSGFKGMGQRMESAGTQMMTSPAQRIQAAGAGAAEAKDLANQATRFGVRAPGVAKQIGGEAVQTAGKHVAHSSPLQLAVNPVGTVVGGGIEGATRGAGRALEQSTGLAGEAGAGGLRAGLGRVMQQHAAHAGLAGEIGMMGAAGGLIHLPLSGAGMVGGHLANQSPMLTAGLHSLGPVGGHIGADLLGTMAHRATKTLPAAARATGRLMQAEA